MALRERLAAGAVGGWLQLPGPATAELMGSVGFDVVCVDTQHGLIGDTEVLPMLQALAAAGTPSLVRVASHAPAAITAALDRGAHGVVVPLVDSAAQAAAVAAACHHPPRGTRSYGPVRPGWLVDPPVPVCVVMVETVAAVDAVAEIVAVDGVDAVLVGPSDLALSAGLPLTAQDGGERAYDELLAQVLAACAAAGVPAGIYCASPAHVRRFRALGFDDAFLRSDAAMLAAMAAADLAAARP